MNSVWISAIGLCGATLIGAVLGFGIFGMTVLSNKNQEDLVAGVCCFSKLSTISVDEEKKSLEKAGNESFGK